MTDDEMTAAERREAEREEELERLDDALMAFSDAIEERAGALDLSETHIADLAVTIRDAMLDQYRMNHLVWKDLPEQGQRLVAEAFGLAARNTIRALVRKMVDFDFPHYAIRIGDAKISAGKGEIQMAISCPNDPQHREILENVGQIAMIVMVDSDRFMRDRPVEGIMPDQPTLPIEAEPEGKTYLGYAQAETEPTSVEYQAGRAAFGNGVPIENCPPFAAAQQSADWQEGWWAEAQERDGVVPDPDEPDEPDAAEDDTDGEPWDLEDEDADDAEPEPTEEDESDVFAEQIEALGDEPEPPVKVTDDEPAPEPRQETRTAARIMAEDEYPNDAMGAGKAAAERGLAETDNPFDYQTERVKNRMWAEGFREVAGTETADEIS